MGNYIPNYEAMTNDELAAWFSRIMPCCNYTSRNIAMCKEITKRLITGPTDLDHNRFEAWAQSKPWFTKLHCHFKRNATGDQYTHYKINDRWLAWREALRGRSL